MTGVGERSYSIGASTSPSTSGTLSAVPHYEDVRDAIQVGHRYDGVVITGVADRCVGKTVVKV
jgi:hypothetical protein